MASSSIKLIVKDPATHFFKVMALFLKCRLAVCKTAARKSLVIVHEALGEKLFNNLVTMRLRGSAQADVLSASRGKIVSRL